MHRGKPAYQNCSYTATILQEYKDLWSLTNKVQLVHIVGRSFEAYWIEDVPSKIACDVQGDLEACNVQRDLEACIARVLLMNYVLSPKKKN